MLGSCVCGEKCLFSRPTAEMIPMDMLDNHSCPSCKSEALRYVSRKGVMKVNCADMNIMLSPMVTCRLNVLLPASCNYSGTYWGYVSGLNKLLIVSLQIELITQVFIDIVITAYQRRRLAQENISRRIVTFSGIRKVIPHGSNQKCRIKGSL